MSTRYKSYRNMSECDRWKYKITNYYARWFTRHIKALVCDKFLLKEVSVNTSSGWGSTKSSFKIELKKLPMTSAFLGAKQLQEHVTALETFFGAATKDDLRGFTRIEHIYIFANSKPAEGCYSWEAYRGMISAQLRRTVATFEICEFGKDKPNEVLENALDLSAWLLEKEISSYDVEVELELEIPFLK